jgi:hypothetical protein
MSGASKASRAKPIDIIMISSFQALAWVLAESGGGKCFIARRLSAPRDASTQAPGTGRPAIVLSGAKIRWQA